MLRDAKYEGKMVELFLPEDTAVRLEQLAEESGRSKADIISLALKEFKLDEEYDSDEVFADKVRKARKALGWSQARLVQEVGESRASAIIAIETGRYSFSPEKRAKLLGVLFKASSEAENNPDRVFAEKIKKAVEDLGWSHSRLVKEVGNELANAISNIDSGRYSFTAEMRAKLLRVFFKPKKIVEQDSDEVFAAKVQKARMAMGWSQERMVKEVGENRAAAIADIENGKYSLSPEMRVKWLDTLFKTKEDDY
ncbi:MAG: helix-turn-helix domain-containing protein [Magnetococcales bacterium]|nr:helix-turn-helix domain-containing protein [Magnetococcales bacterium]